MKVKTKVIFSSFYTINCQIFSIQTFISWMNSFCAVLQKHVICHISFGFLKCLNAIYIYIEPNRQIYIMMFRIKKNEMSYFMYKVIWLMMMSPTLVSCFQCTVVALFLFLVFFSSHNLGSEPGNGTAFIRIWRYCICNGW